jgi:hypothetical protein
MYERFLAYLFLTIWSVKPSWPDEAARSSREFRTSPDQSPTRI